MWPLFMTTAAYAMNSFASKVLNGFSQSQLVFVHDPPNLTSLSFPRLIKIQCHISSLSDLIFD